MYHSCKKSGSTRDRECGAGYRCLQKDICIPFKSKVTELISLARDSPEFKTMLTELKGLVCNKEEKKVCCDICDSIEQSSSACYIPNIENGECGLMEGAAAKRQRKGKIVGELSKQFIKF